MLKDNARLLGISRHFTIFDRSDSLRAIKQATIAAEIVPGAFEPRKILATISKQKGNAHSFTEYSENVRENEYYPRIVVSIWERYETHLKNEKYTITWVKGLDDPNNAPKLVAQRNQEETNRLRKEELTNKDVLTIPEMQELLRLSL